MKQTVVIFISLLIDLLAFTLILPLFPKIFDYYSTNENDSTYKFLQFSVDKFRGLLTTNNTSDENTAARMNMVLFGGMIGSLFSFLQFISSTFMGAASDFYGRKTILLLALFGTLISHVMWSMSSLFIVFLASRIVGGIFKANVSICIASMTDLTKPSERSFAMALVGIAFSLGFIFGPAIGALFSSMKSQSEVIYIYPSYLACALTVINIIFVALFYKDSLPVEKRRRSQSIKSIYSSAMQYVNPVSLFKFAPVKSVTAKGGGDLSALRSIGMCSFLYLFLYSGLEFTLTFLVHDRFNYDSMQQGKMFLFIGILMTAIQGGYVRRIKQGTHIKACIKAILLLMPAFVIIALAQTQLIFYMGLALYAYSSAVVVQCFTTCISNFGSADEKGTLTGVGRSLSALARAFGPIFTSILYWTFGPVFAYILGSLGLILPLCILVRLESQQVAQVFKSS